MADPTPPRRTITETERLKLLGLATLLHNHVAWLELLERTILELLDSPPSTSLESFDLDSFELVTQTPTDWVTRLLERHDVDVVPEDA